MNTNSGLHARPSAHGKWKHAMRFKWSVALSLGLLACLLAVTACHSAYINATVSNRRTTPISLVQVEYPSASFGTQSIAPGQDFKYRFKVLGTGTMKVTYTDSKQAEQKATGPSLKEGDEGALAVTIEDGKVDWDLKSTAH